jgi:hypothetical protein
MSLEIISTITGETIKVALMDVFDDMYENGGEMSWELANIACASLGPGWRLPTFGELSLMYEILHEKGKGNFKNAFYWSSTQDGINNVVRIDFTNGDVEHCLTTEDKESQVRAVRNV